MLATAYQWQGSGEITVDHMDPTSLLRPLPNLGGHRMRALLKPHTRTSQRAAMLSTLRSWTMNYTWRYAVLSHNQSATTIAQQWCYHLLPMDKDANARTGCAAAAPMFVDGI